MTFYPTQLSDNHSQQLEEKAGIAREVIAERGVRTITKGRELPKAFSRRQRRLGSGLLFTGHAPDGVEFYSFRPDRPDPKSPGRKYEMPAKACGGAGNRLDIHPSCSNLIGRKDVPVIFVEGIKKADAILSAARAAGVEVLVVAISGVWNWMSDGEPIPDMFDIPVKGRRVIVCFDSDMLTNPNVQEAAQRLAEHHKDRGADVYMTFLPEQDDGSKNGADDFLASGGTLAELQLLTRRYDPSDFERVRLSRDEKLRRAVEELERRYWSFEWSGMGGATARDVALVLVQHAKRHGQVVGDGVRVRLSRGTLQLEAKLGSSRTLSKAINRLEEWDFAYRDNDARKPDKAGAFVLRASVNNDEEERGLQEKATSKVQTSYARCLHLRAPRLMWSAPAYKPRRGVVSGTRKVRQGPPAGEERPAIKRLGKIRGAILDALDVAGGSLTLQELAAVLHKKRPRDLRRRTLPMLAESGIIVVEGAVVRLHDEWQERLDAERAFGGEFKAAETARRRLALRRQAFHARHKLPAPDPAPTPEELEEMRPAFVAALETQKRARADRMREAALEAFRAEGSGAQRNLVLGGEGELLNVEYVVKSVLAYHRKPVVYWEREWEAWCDPVLEAASIVAHELAQPVPPEPEPPPLDHPLDCECAACLYSEPSYARPYRGSGRRSA